MLSLLFSLCLLLIPGLVPSETAVWGIVTDLNDKHTSRQVFKNIMKKDLIRLCVLETPGVISWHLMMKAFILQFKKNC